MKWLASLLLWLPALVLAEKWRWNFDSPQLNEWAQIGNGEWCQIELPGRGGVLELSKSGKPPAEPVRRPANILMALAPALTAFSIDFEARSLQFERKGADLVVIFGYQDPFNFYYAHISNDVNRVHQVIMKVEGSKKTRNTTQLEKEPVAALKDKWQRVRMTR